MLVFVRHGKTTANNADHETLRGWLPIPLDLEGMKQAEEVGNTLAGSDVSSIKCATLVRVVQTAHEIAEYVGMPLSPMEELNDWNTGDYAGQSVKDTLPKLQEHIQSPMKPVPGGEAFQFFLDRIIPILKDAVESDEVHIIVSSGRVSTLLKALSKNEGKYPDTETLLGKPPIGPAGLLLIDKDWEIVYQTKKDGDEKRQS